MELDIVLLTWKDENESTKLNGDDRDRDSEQSERGAGHATSVKIFLPHGGLLVTYEESESSESHRSPVDVEEMAVETK